MNGKLSEVPPPFTYVMKPCSNVANPSQNHSSGTLLKQWRDQRSLSQLDLAVSQFISLIP